MGSQRQIPNLSNADTMLKVLQFAIQKVLTDPEMLKALIMDGTQEKTLGDVCKDYKKHLLEFGYSVKYQSSVNTTLTKAEFLWGPEIKISEIGAKQVEEFIQNYRRNAPMGYLVDFRNLKAFFEKAVNWNYLKENPCKLVKLPRVQKNKREYLTFDQFQIVLSFVRSTLLKDIYSFAFQTALRLSELLNLRWSDVSINDGTITIGSEQFRTKTKRIRVIPLSETAIEILKRRFPKYINPVNDYVFTKINKDKFSNDYISRVFKRALRKARMKESVCFHSLRHSAISHALNCGAPLSAVREYAGHSNILTTQNYLHTNLEDLKKVSKTFNIAAGDK